MNNIWLVCKKEVQSFLKPSFFIVVALCSIYFGIYYYSILLEYASVSNEAQKGSHVLSFIDNLMVPYFSSINFVLLIACPLISIRLFADEYRFHTFELLLSSPLTSWQIVLGKYLSACIVVSGIVLLASLYVLTALYLLQVPTLQVIFGIIGLLLISYIYLAISLFASSLTSSVVLAGVISIVLCLFLWVLTIFRVDSDGAYISWAHNMWLGTHLIAFLKGGPDIKSISILSSYVFFFLFLCQQSVEMYRWK